LIRGTTVSRGVATSAALRLVLQLLARGRFGYRKDRRRFCGDCTVKCARVTIVTAFAQAVVGALFAAFRSRANLVVENLALRRQLAVLRRRTPRPRLRAVDRAFWVILSRLRSRGLSRSPS